MGALACRSDVFIVGGKMRRLFFVNFAAVVKVTTNFGFSVDNFITVLQLCKQDLDGGLLTLQINLRQLRVSDPENKSMDTDFTI